MVLSDFIKTLPDDEIMYIGSASSYFFIGDKKTLLDDLPILDNQFWEYNVQLFRRRLHECVRYKRAHKPIEYHMSSKYLKNTSKNMFNQSLPLLKRKIVSTHKKILIDEPGTSIIVEGNEYGSFWFWHEYEEKMNGRRKKT